MRSYASLEAIYDKPVNYATESQLIGDSVNQAIQENRDRVDHNLETKRKKALIARERMQMAQLQQAQLETLQIPSDTNIPSADQYYQDISRKLVDQQAGLVASLNRGDISTDEFAQKSAQIKNQIPAIKAGKEGLTSFQSNYQQMLQDNQLSNANDGQAADLYDAITQGTLQIEPDENGEVRMYTEDGAINMPLSAIDRIPQPIAKAQEIGVEVKPVVERLQDSVSWGEDQDESVRLHLDSMLQGNDVQNNKTLEAIAVDALDIPLDKARALIDEAPESSEHGYTNALEELIEQKMIDEARTQWGNNKLKREQDEMQIKLKEAQRQAAIARANREYHSSRSGGKTTQQLQLENQFRKNWEDIGKLDLKSEADVKKVNDILSKFTGGNIDRIDFAKGGVGIKKGSWRNLWQDQEVDYGEPVFRVWKKGAKKGMNVPYSALLQNVGMAQFGSNSPFLEYQQ